MRKQYEVIVIGGSFAGLSAALSLGRSLRRVLVIDSGEPCNSKTPRSHNFLTQDGERPADIIARARCQVASYSTVDFFTGKALLGKRVEEDFAIQLESGELFYSKKVIFATGVFDDTSDIPGLAECWGRSVIHCPYCHGYEVRNMPTGILANGEAAVQYAKLVRNLTSDLKIFTNGISTIPREQADLVRSLGISINEMKVESLQPEGDKLQYLQCVDGSRYLLQVLYAKLPFSQHCLIPEMLGCDLTDLGHIKVDKFQRTTNDGVFACGDNASPMRSIAHAVASGNMAGAAVNKELVLESYS